jgi:hypothetical protein
MVVSSMLSLIAEETDDKMHSSKTDWKNKILVPAGNKRA